MSKKPNHRPLCRGRPKQYRIDKVPISEVEQKHDLELVRDLAKIQCNYKEIAAIMRCSESYVFKHFKEAIGAGREEGKVSLRRAQMRKALEGNVPMLIWLGKNYLDQREEYRIASTFEPEARTLLKKWDAEALKKKNS